ncbi:MAG TPA: hypothetical protein VFX02_13520 [Gammaproteobacteria bacterium]|nr:hypothetical protein [Gammaproteobacteria bacterium]
MIRTAVILTLSMLLPACSSLRTTYYDPPRYDILMVVNKYPRASAYGIDKGARYDLNEEQNKQLLAKFEQEYDDQNPEPGIVYIKRNCYEYYSEVHFPDGPSESHMLCEFNELLTKYNGEIRYIPFNWMAPQTAYSLVNYLRSLPDDDEFQYFYVVPIRGNMTNNDIDGMVASSSGVKINKSKLKTKVLDNVTELNGTCQAVKHGKECFYYVFLGYGPSYGDHVNFNYAIVRENCEKNYCRFDLETVFEGYQYSQPP